MNSDSTSEIAALRNQVFALFVALVVVSGTFTTYIFIQTRHAGADIAQAEQLIDNLKKNEAVVNNLANQLINYGQQHPEFMPLLKKYGLPPAAGAPGSAPAAAPKK